MSYAFTHLIVAWILGKGYELVSKKTIPHLAWGFLLLGAILPDIDLLINKILQTSIHRTLTHSLIFLAGIMILVFLFTMIFKSKQQTKYLSLAIGLGITIHLLLDLFYQPGIQLLWPMDAYFSYFGVVKVSMETLLAAGRNVDYLIAAKSKMIFDMGLGILWLMYFWYRKKIKL